MLPNNEPKIVDITPKNYLIWGESMAGKTYLATQFPNPLLLNTDGNAVKVATPSVDIRDFDQFSQIIAELDKGGHTYESIIIDLVDDLRTMLVSYVCKKYKVQTLSDVRFGKASGEFKDLWLRLMIKLSQMPQNIIFISHMVEANGFDENDIDKPSLQQRELNVCMGRCDISIRCRKVRDNHIQQCDRKRHIYTLADIQDERILKALSNVQNLIKK